jgi:mannitol-specific phosphotransferase system IIBC component
MKITINILPAIGSVIAFGATYSLLTGTAQKFIPFSGALNEFATTMITFLMGALLLFCSFEKVNK